MTFTFLRYPLGPIGTSIKVDLEYSKSLALSAEELMGYCLSRCLNEINLVNKLPFALKVFVIYFKTIGFLQRPGDYDLQVLNILGQQLIKNRCIIFNYKPSA